MSVRNKIRVGSQNHTNTTQKIYKTKEHFIYGIRKVPSMVSESSSPLRNT